jgi:hypothetical protein
MRDDSVVHAIHTSTIATTSDFAICVIAVIENRFFNFAAGLTRSNFGASNVGANTNPP